MTRKTIREHISEGVEDPLNIQFTESIVNAKIQDGYSLAVLLSKCRISAATINFVDDKIYYTISDSISDFYKPLAIFNNNINRWMTPAAIKQIDSYDAMWELSHAEPHIFIPVGVDTIAFYPHQLAASGSFQLYYAQQADTLTDSSSPQFYSELHMLLEDFGKGELYAEIFEFAKATASIKEFQEKLAELISKVDDKGMFDRIYQHIMHYGTMD